MASVTPCGLRDSDLRWADYVMVGAMIVHKQSLDTEIIPRCARLGRTLRSWQREFLAYFATGRASNGPTEAVNLIIEKTRRLGHGFRNFDNYRLRLLLHCGGDWDTIQATPIRGRLPRSVA